MGRAGARPSGRDEAELKRKSLLPPRFFLLCGPMRIRTFLRSAVLSATLAATGLAAPAMAQNGQSAPLTGEAWARQQLSDLANILGGAHYLRILCQGRTDQRWRDYMRGVIQHYPNYRDMLTEQFNAGYRDQEQRYQECDATASQAEAELRARGLRISNGLSARNAATPTAPPHE